MASLTHSLGSLVGHAALIGVLVLMGANRGCSTKFPERLGGGDGSEFTFVDLLPGLPPAPPPERVEAPPPEPEREPPKPEPPKVPDPEAVKLPDPVKKPPAPRDPPKKIDPPKPPVKKPDPVKKTEVKKPDPAKVKAEEAARKLEELRRKWAEADQKFAKVNGATAPVNPGAGKGPGVGPGPAGPGSPNGSAAVSQVEDELYRKLHSVWDQPRGASSFLTTDVWIRIAPSGVILDKRVVKSSGDREMDQTVLDAVAAARAIAPLPRDLRNGYETTFRFRVTN